MLRPCAGCQVVPPSVETSTLPTWPPPDSPATSVAVPLIVTGAPLATLEPSSGELITELGGAVSVEAVAPTRSPCSVSGWAPMSASTLTVACCMRGSGVEPPRS